VEMVGEAMKVPTLAQSHPGKIPGSRRDSLSAVHVRTQSIDSVNPGFAKNRPRTRLSR
jgi:hypothetical protein